MSHIFQVPDDIYGEIVTYAAKRGLTPENLLMTLLEEGVDQLKQTDSMRAIQKVPYDPAHDPLAPFIGRYEIDTEDFDWIDQHDKYFGGIRESKELYGDEN
jgi:hypothetical protein